MPVAGFKIILLLLFVSVTPTAVNAQESFENDTSMAYKYLQERGEVYFSFEASFKEVRRLSNMISIDNYSDNTVFAYANLYEFESFLKESLEFTVYSPPGEWNKDIPSIREKSEGEGVSLKGVWNYYPSYTEYVDMMQSWADDYSHICEYIDAGKSVEGRSILFLKITGKKLSMESRPRFMYSSTMHGDETVGFVLMLRLIEYLLENYNVDPRVEQLLDNLEIWINPLANPDAAYFGGDDNIIDSPKRSNANNIDLNRDFQVQGESGITFEGRQPETVVMMELMIENRFLLSANFHGGQEVINYPWDLWERRHADDRWFEYICREYADTAILYSPDGYMTFNGGVVNGYQWYPVTGGRQDFVTYYTSGREVTMEISSTKHPPSESLPAYWEYNKRSLLNYMEQALFGIRGNVRDAYTGEPVSAKIEVLSHDIDNSFVYTDPLTGAYFRLLEQGVFDIMFSADGYSNERVNGYQLWNRETGRLDIDLLPLGTGSEVISGPESHFWKVYPLPASQIINVEIFTPAREEVHIFLYDRAGRKVKYLYNGIIEPDGVLLSFDIDNITPGIYLLELKTSSGVYSSQIIISGS